MLKASITKTVNTDKVKCDSTLQRVWKYAINPEFFNDAIKRFKYYTNAVAYEFEGVFFVISQYCALQALLELGLAEITLDIIDIHKNDIIEFLLSFQYQEHKETRCLAELIKVTKEYIATVEGKKWLKTITNSDDKEEQLSELFGITNHAAKCYLKLIQPGNEKYLDMLAKDKNYRLSTAYDDCRAEQKRAENVDDNQPDTQTGSDKCKAPTKAAPDYSNPETTTDPDQSAPTTDVETTDQTTSSEPTADQDGSNEDEYRKYLEKYEKGDSTSDEKVPPPPLAQKVLVILSDGKQLELVGKIKLTVDGEIINNTGQLKKLANGDWGLLSFFDSISLTLVVENDFFKDF